MGQRIMLRRCEHSRHSRFIGCPRCFTGPVRFRVRPALSAIQHSRVSAAPSQQTSPSWYPAQAASMCPAVPLAAVNLGSGAGNAAGLANT
jgi:hypothetical protein